jgi:hypothetical protein
MPQTPSSLTMTCHATIGYTLLRPFVSSLGKTLGETLGKTMGEKLGETFGETLGELFYLFKVYDQKM